MKSEPNEWSWKDQVEEGISMWDGVRNYQARNNLMSVKKNDLSFFYHSVSEKAIIGILKIVREFYPDPTDKLESSLLPMLKHLRSLKIK